MRFSAHHRPAPEDELQPVATLELLGLKCPENSMRATLKLDELDEGEVLELIVDGGETLTTMVPNLEDEGYPVLRQTERPDGTWSVLVRA